MSGIAGADGFILLSPMDTAKHDQENLLYLLQGIEFSLVLKQNNSVVAEVHIKVANVSGSVTNIEQSDQ